MINSNTTIQENEDQRLSLQAKLDDTIELLHLWKGEACSYRLLAEAIVTGRISHDQAQSMLSRVHSFESSSLKVRILEPTAREYSDFLARECMTELEPEQLLRTFAQWMIGR